MIFRFQFVCLLLVYLMLHCGLAQAEQESTTKQTYEVKLSDHSYLNGFEQSISGKNINYHSPSPDIRSALISRANTGKMAIEWETESVRFRPDQDEVRFIWLAGLGCNLGVHNFDFYMDGDYQFSFATVDEDTWQVSGNRGEVLAFESIMIDNSRDRFGLMILTLPKSNVQEGKALRLRIIGRKENSSAWVMTFKGQLKEKLTILPGKALLKGEVKLAQPLILSLIYFGQPGRVRAKIEGAPDQQLQLTKMFNRFTISVPEVKSVQKTRLQLLIDEREIFDKEIIIEPVRRFTMYLVQHSHTDMGYTRPQTDILSEHLRYLDYALDYCDQTDDYPDAAKFRWTCESSWPVREYLQNRPATQIERLRKRVQEGRIELTAMMFNMSEIADEASYVDFVQAVDAFKKKGMAVKTAMQNDVNGFAWCLVDYFQDTGVEYLSMGTHGHKALIAFEHPTPFWLESPSGNRLLAFRADHYMTGNFIGVHGKDLYNLEEKLFIYLDDLFNKGYSYDQIAVQHSGYFTDNSPPGLAVCDMVKRWNDKYEWPKLRTAVANDFLEQMKAQHGDELPVYRSAWPDWWTDGFGSAARETAASRVTHAEMNANLGLLSMAKMSGAELPNTLNDKISAVQDALLFYDEHTFGAAESISDPMAENTHIQWMEKAAYVWDAVKNSRLIAEYGMGLIQPFLSRSIHPTITVFNTLSWQRSGVMRVYIDNEILPKDRAFRIIDDDGNKIEAQLEKSRSEGNFWALWLEDIPALGYKSYRIEVKDRGRSAMPALSAKDLTLENGFYRLQIDLENGALVGLFDKELNKELADNSGEWRLGQLIYETSDPRGQLDNFSLDKYQRMAWKDIEVHAGIDGPIWSSMFITGTCQGFDKNKGIELEIRLFKKTKRIDFHYSLRKLEILEPESVYIAFPFQMPGSKVIYEVQGGVVEPGKDQIPGSASDWNTFQNFIVIRDKDAQIVWGSDAMPLVQLGDINLGKFMYIAEVNKPHIYSWPMNNLWVTNFRASQEGDLTWSYYFTSTEDRSTTSATRFGWGARIPFFSRVLPTGKEEEPLSSRSFLHIEEPNILLVSSRPAKDGNGIVLQLRELEGKATTLSVDKMLPQIKEKDIIEVNVLEEKRAAIKDVVQFRPYEVKFIKAIMINNE